MNAALCLQSLVRVRLYNPRDWVKRVVFSLALSPLVFGSESCNQHSNSRLQKYTLEIGHYQSLKPTNSIDNVLHIHSFNDKI